MRDDPIKQSPIHGLDNNIYGNIGVDGRMSNPSKLQGVFRARVEYNQDPNQQGRVQLRIPELHGLKTDGGVSTENLPWASLLGSSAGFGYGQFMVPEVGEYVMVQFEDGNPYKPIVMGSVFGAGARNPKEYGTDEVDDDEKWNSIEHEREVAKENLRIYPSLKTLYKSPTGANISIDEKRETENIMINDGLGQYIKIKTNIDPKIKVRKGPDVKLDSKDCGIEIKDYGGQIMEFNATKKSCKISIRSIDGYEVLIEPRGEGFLINAVNAKIHIDKKGNMTIDTKEKIDITAKKNITVKSDKKIDLEAKEDVTIEAKQNIKLDAKQNVDIQAAENIVIKAASNVTVEASDTAEVHGENVNVNGSEIEVNGDHINIQADPSEIGTPVILYDPIFA